MIYIWYIKKEHEDEAKAIISRESDVITEISALNRMCELGKGQTCNNIGGRKTINRDKIQQMILDCENNPNYTRVEVYTDATEDYTDIEELYKSFRQFLYDNDTLMLHSIASGECGEKPQEMLRKAVTTSRKFNNPIYVVSEVPTDLDGKIGSDNKLPNTINQVSYSKQLQELLNTITKGNTNCTVHPRDTIDSQYFKKRIF